MENETDSKYLWFMMIEGRSQWRKIPSESGQCLEQHFRSVETEEGPYDRNTNFSVIFENNGKLKCSSKDGAVNETTIKIRREHYSCLSWSWYWREKSFSTFLSKVIPSIPELIDFYVQPAQESKWHCFDLSGYAHQLEQMNSQMLEEQYQKYKLDRHKAELGSTPNAQKQVHRFLLIPVNHVLHQLDFENFTLENLATGSEKLVRRRPKVDDETDVAKPEEWLPANLKRHQKILTPGEKLREIKGIRKYSMQYEDIYNGQEFKILFKKFSSGDNKPTGYTSVVDQECWTKYQNKRSQIIANRGADYLNETILLKEIELDDKFFSDEFDENSTCSAAFSDCFKRGSKLVVDIGDRVKDFTDQSTEDCSKKAIGVLLVCVGKFTGKGSFDNIDDNLHDSLVDDAKSPRWVIVAKTDQICPLYIIKYY